MFCSFIQIFFFLENDISLSLSLSLSLSQLDWLLEHVFFIPSTHVVSITFTFGGCWSGCCDHSRGLLVLISVQWLLRFAMVVEIGTTLGWDHGCGLWLLKLVWWLLRSIVVVKIGMLWLLKVSFFSTLDANALMWKFKRLSMWNKSHEALTMSCN